MAKTVFILGGPEQYGNYLRAVEAAGGQVRFGAAPEDSANADALLLPGGGDLEPWRYGQENTASRGLEPQRDAAEFLLLERFTVCRKPILGICRGLQTINVFFGGTLCQDVPGHSAVNGQDGFHEVRTAGSAMTAFAGNGVVNSAHHQAVDRTGAGLIPVQWAPDGIIEALVHPALPLWAVQWHPERLPDLRVRSALFRAFLALDAPAPGEKNLRSR